LEDGRQSGPKLEIGRHEIGELEPYFDEGKIIINKLKHDRIMAKLRVSEERNQACLSYLEREQFM
jgi:hypothetical protein